MIQTPNSVIFTKPHKLVDTWTILSFDIPSFSPNDKIEIYKETHKSNDELNQIIEFNETLLLEFPIYTNCISCVEIYGEQWTLLKIMETILSIYNSSMFKSLESEIIIRQLHNEYNIRDKNPKDMKEFFKNHFNIENYDSIVYSNEILLEQVRNSLLKTQNIIFSKVSIQKSSNQNQKTIIKLY